jgi:hypothetical protein
MKLENVVPWGRSLTEYQVMFALSEEDLQKRILGCGDGPASFNAEMTSSGRQTVTSVDPLYAFSVPDITRRITETEQLIMADVRTNAAKGNQAEKEAIDRGSGAGSFGRDPDVILDFTDHEDTSPAKPIFSVSVIIREFEHIGDFVVYWEPPLLIKDTTGLNPHDLKQRQKAGRPKKDKEYDQAIMAALYGAEEGGGLSWTRLA